MTPLDYLKPDTETPPRPTDPAAIEVVRSHLLLRALVGMLGILLPIVLVLGDIIFLKPEVSARGSLSAYYHSGMRDVFVGILAVAGMGLIGYKLSRKNSGENRLSTLVGIAVIGVALFPVRVPPGLANATTPLQNKAGETFVATIHYIAATIFIIGIGVVTLFFGIREAKREPHNNRLAAKTWARFHFTMTGLIAAALLFIGVTQLFNFWDDHSLLIGQTIAVWAFGASWLAKGLELDLLLGRDRATSAATSTGAAA